MDEQIRELASKFFVDREPKTTEEKLAYATAILELYADPAHWNVNHDRRHGEHRMGERIVLQTHNIVAGYSFAYEFIERVRDKKKVAPKRSEESSGKVRQKSLDKKKTANRGYGREFAIFCFGVATAGIVMHTLQLLQRIFSG